MDLLAACFLLGIVGLICVNLIVPCIVAANKILNDEGDRTQQALVRIKQDAASTSAAGLNFWAAGKDWDLAVVPLDAPSSEARRVWKTELIVYRYRSSSQVITRRVFHDLKWPDGTPRLTGGEPAPFTAEEMAGLEIEGWQTIASSIEGDAWPGLAQAWSLRFVPKQGKPRAYALNLGDL